jgi:bifunctional non-homologous end joining protein LigD
VGTGYTEKDLNEIRAALRPIEDPDGRERVDRAPQLRGSHWVRPELVAEVTFKDITTDGMIRHGSFMRLRDDKPPEECRAQEEELEAADADGNGAPRLPDPPPMTETADRAIKFTNLDKLFWPDDGFTKGDLIEYYREVSPWLLPYLADRPVVLTRYPDGIQGKSFYQKDAPSWAPEWIRRVRVRSDSSEKDVNYFVAEDVDALLYLANLGTIPLHIWHSRAAALDRPDWCLLDLDPKDAPFAHVVEIALFLHSLCEDLGLPHYVKTSGSSGLHVLIPLGRQMTYDQSVTLGELIARTVVTTLPKISTIERTVKKRGGKVYVDFLQNREGQLMAAPFSVREKPGATVSTPLRWKEVGPKLAIADHTIANVPKRMKALKGGDPLAPVLEESPDLLSALEKLMARGKR